MFACVYGESSGIVRPCCIVLLVMSCVRELLLLLCTVSAHCCRHAAVSSIIMHACYAWSCGPCFCGARPSWKGCDGELTSHSGKHDQEHQIVLGLQSPIRAPFVAAKYGICEGRWFDPVSQDLNTVARITAWAGGYVLRMHILRNRDPMGVPGLEKQVQRWPGRWWLSVMFMICMLVVL